MLSVNTEDNTIFEVTHCLGLRRHVIITEVQVQGINTMDHLVVLLIVLEIKAMETV